jgi:hypothetical protein
MPPFAFPDTVCEPPSVTVNVSEKECEAGPPPLLTASPDTEKVPGNGPVALPVAVKLKLHGGGVGQLGGQGGG